MKGKSQSYYRRGSGKVQASVLLPESLVDKVQQLADKEHRSRNQQIELILEQWMKENGSKSA